MILSHYFCMCIMCGETLEIFTEDERREKVQCCECEYNNDLKDTRLKTWIEEF